MRSMLAVLVLAWPVVAADPTFDGTVAPFLKAHCAKCHGDTDPQAGLKVSALDPNPATAKEPGLWNDLRLRLLAGEMPPEKEARPKATEVAAVVGWIEAELKKNPKVKLRQPPDSHHPRFGNCVDHEGLFDPAPGTVSSTPQRVWRLGAIGYEALLDDLRKREYGFIQPFGVAAEGFTEYAARLLADEAVALQLIRNAEQTVDYQCSAPQKKGRKTGVQPVKEFVTLAGASAVTRPQMEGAVRTQFKLVLLREPTADETKRFTTLMAKATADTGHPLGMKTALAAVLLTPEALYRTEFGEGKPDEHGRLRLAPREVVFALAFALTDKRPDAELLAAAGAGKLATREGVAVQVKRLLNDPTTDKPRVLRFFREYFGYAGATEVFKNPEDFKDHSPYALVRDTDHLVEDILVADQNVLVELLTTRKSYVGILQEPGKKRNFADSVLLKGHAYPSYNLPARPDTASQPVELPAAERMGILTQPSWLVAFSENTDNHAILRGKWVRERLLGGTIPDLPITVNAQLPDEPKKTLRERMAVTREAYCWQCHQKMNPLGLSFEVFDHFGRFRTQELGKPVDATGKLDGQIEKKLAGDTKDAFDLIAKLAASDRARQVFVRHAFRYWLGRNESLSDGPVLVAADKAYRDSGGSMKALIETILTSDAFLYRKPPGR